MEIDIEDINRRIDYAYNEAVLMKESELAAERRAHAATARRLVELEHAIRKWASTRVSSSPRVTAEADLELMDAIDWSWGF